MSFTGFKIRKEHNIVNVFSSHSYFWYFMVYKQRYKRKAAKRVTIVVNTPVNGPHLIDSPFNSDGLSGRLKIVFQSVLLWFY